MANNPVAQIDLFSANGDDIKRQVAGFVSMASTANQTFWYEANKDRLFEAGDARIMAEAMSNLVQGRSQTVNFPRLRRGVNMIEGHQRQNRRSYLATPLENATSHTADQFSRIMFWLAARNNRDELMSTAFRDALITGIGWMYSWIDYRNDPVNGDIIDDLVGCNEIMIDPFYKRKDLSDCRAILKRSYLSPRNILSLMPAYKQEILQVAGRDIQDDKFMYTPEANSVEPKNLMKFDEFYYLTYRKQRMLRDTRTGECREWLSNDMDKMRVYLQTFPEISVTSTEVPCVKLAILINDRCVFNDYQPSGIDRYPFTPTYGYFNPNILEYENKYQGIIRNLRDAQVLYNRRKWQELNALDSVANSGYFYKPDGLIDPQQVHQTGDGVGIGVKAGYNIPDVVQPIPPAVIPDSSLQVSNIIAGEINQILGISDEALGTAIDDVAGILAMNRLRASMAGLQPLFDNVDLAGQMLERLHLDMIQRNFTPGKVQQILGGEKPSDHFYGKEYGKYDVIIEDGVNTSTQRQQAQAQGLILRKAGVAIPDEFFIENLTVPNRDKLMAMIDDRAQQEQQLKMAQMQAQIEQLQAQTELTRARSVADQGLGLERLSRVQENKFSAVERLTQAQQNEKEAELAEIKALKELEGIDMQQLERAIRIMKMLESDNVTDQVKGTINENQGQGPQEAYQGRM